MPHRDDIVLWLDLETSGSGDDALIFEVGMAVTGPGPNFDILASTDIVLAHTLPLAMDPVVIDMHTKNGLFEEIKTHGVSAEEAENQISQFIHETFGFSKQHVVLAGSGVGHFDRKFIKRDWPWLDKRLAYFCYDVGVLRRFLRMVGITTPETKTDQLTHRALDDVFDHINEARALLEAAQNHETPMVGITTPETKTDQLTHRALDDVFDHIYKARALLAAAQNHETP